MPTDIILPNAGFDTHESRILEWLVSPGDHVNKGDVIAVIESDKANVELESLATGVVLNLFYAAETDVPIGATIARIGNAEEAVAEALTKASAVGDAARVSPLARRIASENRIDLTKVAGSGTRGRVTREDVEHHSKLHHARDDILALPKVRRAAREAGIDLVQVSPTGTRGQITLADLVAYQKQADIRVSTADPVQSERQGIVKIPLSRMRQTIASRLQKSMQDAPHFYVTGEFDLEAAMAHLKTLPEPRPKINDLIQYLAVRTLIRRLPQLNATFEEGQLYHHDSVHLAIAVARDDGLLTPVLRGADRFSLEGLMKETRALIQRARDNRLQPTDLSGGTFTISNLGMISQVDHFTAVINPPQVAILAVGTVKQRPVIIKGGIHAHHTVHLSLSGDHRVVDGMTLAQFLAIFQQELDSFAL